MGAITAHAHNLDEIGFIFFLVGFIGMIFTFPLVIYRYINYKDIPNANMPLIVGVIVSFIVQEILVARVKETKKKK